MIDYNMLRPKYSKDSGYEIEYTTLDGDRLELKIGCFRSRNPLTKKTDKYDGALLTINGEILDLYKDKGTTFLLKQDNKRKSLETLAKQRVSGSDFIRLLSKVSARPNQIFPYSELKIISDKTLFRKNSGYKLSYTSKDKERIRLYVGEFSEKVAKSNKEFNDSVPEEEFKIVRKRFYGAVILLNCQEVEKYRSRFTVSNLTEEKKRLIGLAKSRVDFEEFLQYILEVENIDQEQCLLESLDNGLFDVKEVF